MQSACFARNTYVTSEPSILTQGIPRRNVDTSKLPFGAPLATHIPQTALLAFVVAVLTDFTPAFVLGVPSLGSDTGPSMINRLTWTRPSAELSKVKQLNGMFLGQTPLTHWPRNTIGCAMVYPVVGTFTGGWPGAIPITLDWDCPS
ncbi:hypothetical protein HD554DRAFT_1790661 [Boletus coccyginus]|nr:hypothetical protein HD554DRAFT_1790661 [Boletus coccyginus]